MCTFRFEAIGTHWEIETHELLGRRLEQRILERIEHFDATYSRFRPDSLVSQIAAAPGWLLRLPRRLGRPLQSL